MNEKIHNPAITTLLLTKKILINGTELLFKIETIDGVYLGGKELYLGKDAKLYRPVTTCSSTWFSTDIVGYSSYSQDTTGYTRVTHNKVTYLFSPSKLKGELVKRLKEDVPVFIKPAVGKSYVTSGGARVRVVAFEDNMDFVSEPQFIAVGLKSPGITHALRYDLNGYVLSHGKDAYYNLVREFSDQIVYIILIKNGAEFKTLSYTDRAAFEAAKNTFSTKVVKTYQEVIEAK